MKDNFDEFYLSNLKKSNKITKKYKIIHLTVTLITLLIILYFLESLSVAKVIIFLVVLSNYSLQVNCEKEKEKIKKIARILYRLQFTNKK
ncbi:MAG: hypothetical protein ACOCQA_04010 [bacterium]